MARVKGAMMTRKRRNKILKMAKGYWGSKSKHFRVANQAVDPAPWGAEEVLQRYRSGEPVNQFLLCWPGRMAEVDLPWDWDLTADQMALIGETLREA